MKINHLGIATKGIDEALKFWEGALGLENEIGSLEPGKQADLAVVSLERAAQMPVHDVYTALVFASNAHDVRLTIVAGEEVCRDRRARKIDERELKAKLNEIREKMRV